MKLSQYYPLVVGIGLTRFNLEPDFFILLALGESDPGASVRFRDDPSASCLAGTQGGDHEIGMASMGSKILQSSSSSSEML